MARKTSIDRMPEDVRLLIKGLRKSGRTIDEILAKLQELDVTIPRSTLGRHVKGLDEVVEDIEAMARVAEVVVDREEADDDRAVRANIQLLQALISRLMREKRFTDTKDAMQLATALERTIRSAQGSLAYKEKIEKRAAEKAAARAVAAVESASKTHGFIVPPEALAAIHDQVYGLTGKP